MNNVLMAYQLKEYIEEKNMKYINIVFTIIILSMLFCFGKTQAQDTTSVKPKKEILNKKSFHGNKFVDKNGDGYNDNAPDHDGDGIPNGLDPDYLKLKIKMKKHMLPYVDADGDGINDNLKFNPFMKGFGKNKFNIVTPQNGGNQNGGNQSGGNNNGNGQRNQKGKGGKK